MNSKSQLVSWLSDHDLMVRGSRNDDAVNISILAVCDNGVPETVDQLRDIIEETVSYYKLSWSDTLDESDLEDRLCVILPYLSTWEDNGILSYAID